MKKETFEWIHSWCDYTEKNDLPRVLLVGDSICYGYQEKVRELLKGVAYVDYLSTSYSIDNPLYVNLVKSFYFNSNYDVLHFNHGLHGFHNNITSYKSRVKKLLEKLDCKKTIIATSTVTYKENNKKIDSKTQKITDKRNLAVFELAKEQNYTVNDLSSVSFKIPLDLRRVDGIHYTEEGSSILAKYVAEKIKEQL